MSWRSRIVGYGEEDPTQLLANPENWRTHPGRQRDALRGSLNSVGWVQAVTVNTVTGHVVDGHARIEESISRGEPKVPVLYVELTPDEERLVLATLDPITGLAGTDQTRLDELLGELTVDDEALTDLLNSLGSSDAGAGMTHEERMAEWGGMPEFDQKDQMGYGQVVVHFLDAAAMDLFARTIGRPITPKTRMIWYPEGEFVAPLSQRFVTESPEDEADAA